MSDPVAPAETTPPADPAQDDAAFQQILRLMLDAGTQILQDLVADPLTAPADKVEPYERLTRSMRRSIALARHITDHPAEHQASPAERRTQSRRAILRSVEDAIDRAERPERPECSESIRDELNERLDDPAFETELATRSVEDIIGDLRQDLGLERTIYGAYTRRTPADIRDLNTRAAAPPRPRPDPAPPETEPAYQPGQTRPNGILARYGPAPDG